MTAPELTPEQVESAKQREAERARDTPEARARTLELQARVAAVDVLVPRIIRNNGDRPMCAGWNDHLERPAEPATPPAPADVDPVAHVEDQADDPQPTPGAHPNDVFGASRTEGAA